MGNHSGNHGRRSGKPGAAAGGDPDPGFHASAAADGVPERTRFGDHEFRGQFPAGRLQSAFQQCDPSADAADLRPENAAYGAGDHRPDPDCRRGPGAPGEKHLRTDDQLLGVPARGRLHPGGDGPVFPEIRHQIGLADHGGFHRGLDRLYGLRFDGSHRRTDGYSGFRQVPVHVDQRFGLRFCRRDRDLLPLLFGV